MPVRTTKSNLIVKQNEEQPVPTEILADAIVDISRGVKRLTASGLNRKAIEVLIRDSCGVSLTDIRKVIDSLGTLADKYTTKGK